MLNAYPNPSRGIACIPVNVRQPMNGKPFLTGIFGREITTIYSGHLSKGEKNYFISTVNITAGIYMLVLQTDEGNSVQKLVIK